MDSGIHDALVILITTFVVGYGLLGLYALLRRRRPELELQKAIVVGFGLRALAAFALPLTGVERTLRGGDEITFVTFARHVAETPFGTSSWTDSLTSTLHEFLFSIQIGLLDAPDSAMRMTQIAISMAGLVLLAVTVYELAGPRAAGIAMWVMALEPTNIFFSSMLHKEPLMMLAGGMVAFGGAMIWTRQELRWLTPIVAGCLIAIATRPYAGWFLIAAGAATVLHASFRASGEAGLRRIAMVALVVLLAAVSAPTILQASTNQSLEQNLQEPADFNASFDEANLGFERVDFSTRTAVITNLPTRIRDVLTRPYIWQLGNLSQQLGVIGGLFTLAVLYLLAREFWRSRGSIMTRAGPLIYVGIAVLIAYSLSAGNAGTAFRYRTHIVSFALCVLVTLWVSRTNAEAAEAVAT